MPSNLISINDLSRCNMVDNTRPLKKAPNKTTSFPIYCEITTKTRISKIEPLIRICEAAVDN